MANILLLILGAFLLLLGVIGDVLPGLPGVPLSYAGLLLASFSDTIHFSWQFLVVWLVITAVVQVLDFVIPAWGTKRFGGTKWGVWGSMIGLILGLFTAIFGPWGIIIGPFVGAVVGELLHGQATGTALKAGFGSFIGLLGGTMLKLICSGLMIYYYIAALV